jgi:hypothetical protein
MSFLVPNSQLKWVAYYGEQKRTLLHILYSRNTLREDSE